MRVLVCGGRHFNSGPWMAAVLNTLHAANRFTLLIHGGATGADSMADVWARKARISVHRFPADWNTHGRAAGAIRNQQMLDEGRPDLVVAFPGGAGTADMMRRARKAGVPLEEPAKWPAATATEAHYSAAYDRARAADAAAAAELMDGNGRPSNVTRTKK